MVPSCVVVMVMIFPTVLTTSAIEKRIFNLRKKPLNQSEAINECKPDGALFDLRSPATNSVFNLIFAYISTGILAYTDRMWTDAIRGFPPTLHTWYWSDMEQVKLDVLDDLSYIEYVDRLNVNCSSVKYSLALKKWRFLAENCIRNRTTICETTTDKPCDYHNLGGLRMNSSIATVSTTNSTSLESCKERCNSWIFQSDKECWFIAFNPATYECEIFENDVMPSEYESCDWFVRDALWVTGRRVCYELNVYDVNDTLVRYPACNYASLPNPDGLGSSTKSEQSYVTSRQTVSSGINPSTDLTTCVKYCRCEGGSKGIHDDFMAEILDLLKMDEKNTSSYRRLFTSAPDDRPMSVGLGWTGIALLIFVGAGILALDSGRLYQDAKTLLTNTKQVFGTSG